MRLWRVAALGAVLACSTLASAQVPIPIDRAVVCYQANEFGGASKPQFIFERILAFQARIEALAEVRRTGIDRNTPYDERHVRAAIDRHIAEQLLNALPSDPPITDDDVKARLLSTRFGLIHRVGSEDALLDAAVSEGIDASELGQIIRRQARAAVYIDRMIAPMLDPSDAELLEVFRAESTPFRGQPFEKVATPLRHWYLSERLSSALSLYYQGARSRVRVIVLATH